MQGNVWTVLPGGDAVEFPSEDGGAREIWAYCDRLSYRHADNLKLYVHTTAPTYDVQILRDGAKPVVAASFEGNPGRRQATPTNAFEIGCQWRDPLTIELAEMWPPGAYLVRLIARYADGSTVEAEAFFVLRRSQFEKGAPEFALVLCTSTWTAYNDWGGANHYRSVRDGRPTDEPAPILSRRRPWARGFLALPPAAPRHTDAPDLPRNATPSYAWLSWALANGYSRHYPDAGWAHYERHFVVWAEQNGFSVDILTQDDLHDGSEALRPYKAALFVGHDEYWTSQMRDAVDRFVDAGGAVARFAGNFVWQVRIEALGDDPMAVQVCFKVPQVDPIFEAAPERSTTYWDSAIVNRPGALTFGLSGAQGCYARFGLCSPRSAGAFTVYRPHHWALADTDLRYGDLIGAAPARVASFELDGADYTFRHGLPYATGIDGAPLDLEIIAMAPATLGERSRPGQASSAPLEEVQGLEAIAPAVYATETDQPREYGSGMIASFRRGRGEVFCAGACHWVNGLIVGDEAVATITRNVLNRFRTRQQA